MSYQVLARKWRPKTFAEVTGQEHVLRALSNALTEQRLHHAYLFTGTRGIGKTTIARILAKCLNCETGVTATPCLKCDACSEIDSGRFFDLIEVDAASRTKVEDTRDLLDNVQYLPTKGRFKIYLIDEVHMLSGHSFNALLKTLEEPPAHVKFLFATTDPQKLPITVLSRCLQFNLKAINPELIQKQLSIILEKEQINFESPALRQLALAARGSVRDALSILDQAIAYGQGKVLLSDVDSLLGTIEKTKLLKLINALADNKAQEIFKIIDELTELAQDFSNVLEEMLKIFHQIALIQAIPQIDTSNWDNVKGIQYLAKKISPENTQLYYQIGLMGRPDLELAPSPSVGFEMILLRMLAFLPENVETKQLFKDEANIINNQPKVDNPSKNQPFSEENLLEKINVTGPTKALLSHAVIEKISDSQIDLLLDPNQAPLMNKKHEERLSQAFSEYFKKPINVTINIGDGSITTRAKVIKQEIEHKKIEANKSIENDIYLKKIINKFDATIIPDSIKIKE